MIVTKAFYVLLSPLKLSRKAKVPLQGSEHSSLDVKVRCTREVQSRAQQRCSSRGCIQSLARVKAPRIF